MGNRKHSKIDQLDPKLKDTVEEMLKTGSTYREVVEFLAEYEIPISTAAVCRHAQNLNMNIQQLKMAHENSRIMMAEMEKYPDLDATSAIIQLTTNNMFQRIANTKPEDWDDIKLDKLLKESTALVRATAYKKRIDIQNQDVMENGIEEIKSVIFASMAKEKPELYQDVVAYLNEKKNAD